MLVGAAEDVAKQRTPTSPKLEMDKARLAGLDSIRLTQTWATGQTTLGPNDEAILPQCDRRGAVHGPARRALALSLSARA